MFLLSFIKYGALLLKLFGVQFYYESGARDICQITIIMIIMGVFFQIVLRISYSKWFCIGVWDGDRGHTVQILE